MPTFITNARILSIWLRYANEAENKTKNKAPKLKLGIKLLKYKIEGIDVKNVRENTQCIGNYYA